MKMIIVVALAFVAAAAVYEEPIKTIRSEFVQQPEGYVFRMLKVFTCLVLCCALSWCQAYPYVAPAAIPVPIVPRAPILPITPFSPSPRPLIPGLPGYNNPYYNQYNRVPGVAGVPAAVVPGAIVPILTYSSEHVGDGSYAFSFTTADGKQAQESGYLKDAFIDNAGEPQGTQVIQGSYAYISPEGTPIQVSYIADENGFRPSGVHIPADGKALAAIPLIADNKQALDPLYNRYNPFATRNRFNVNGRYSSARPYDPRYPYEAANYNPLYSNYNSYVQPTTIQNKNELKKTA